MVDATFREEERRRTFLEAAVRWGVPTLLLVCHAGAATVRQRLSKRYGDVSDADWSVYLEVAKSWEAVGARTRRLSHAVSTEGRPEQAISRALEVLQQLGLHG